MELFKVVTVEEARKIIDDNFNLCLGCEEVGLWECGGRIAYKDIVSDSNVPPFRRSTVDGYALKSRDIYGASESIPSILNLIGEVQMGKPAILSLCSPGDCMYVSTGGMIPDGADCVVMVEYTEKLDDNTVLVNSPAAYGDNVIDIGEDIKKGEVVLYKGNCIRPYEAGVLASIGYDSIPVYKKPKVAIISTGDEIVGPYEVPALGQVRDINTYLLYSAVLADGGEPVNYGLIKDEYSLLKDTVDKAVEECDIVLISGGSSVGKRDQTLKVMNSFGEAGVLVHGISAKPGKPTIIGKAKDKIIYGLPGHPMACAIIYKVLVKYYIDSLTSSNDNESYQEICKFSINYHKAKGREEYLPVTLKWDGDEIIAEPVFGKSGLITGFSKAWGYIKIDRNLEGLKEGQKVYAWKL